MITTLKAIQIILVLVFMIPSMYILIREPFLKKSAYRKVRLTTFSWIWLITSFIFMILSIIVTDLDSTYKDINFAAFNQMYIIIKSVVIVYAQVIGIIILLIGILALYCVCTNNGYSSENYYLITFEEAHYYLNKMTTFDKIFRYSHFYLDCSVMKKKLVNKNMFLIGYWAYEELNKFDKRLNTESKKEKRTTGRKSK